MKPTKVSQVIEAIVTHTAETITVAEIHKELPDLKIQDIRTIVCKAAKLHVKPTRRKKGHGRRHPAIYKIISREPYKPTGRKSSTRRRKPSVKSTLRQKPDVTVSADKLGEAVIMYIEKLKVKVRDLSTAYSDMQRMYNQEQRAYQLLVKENQKSEREMKEKIEQLQKRIRQLKPSDKVFTVGEMAEFT